MLPHADSESLCIPTPTGLTLEFNKDYPYGPDDPYVEGMLVRAIGDRVRIEQQVILVGGRGLPGFLRDLSEDFRGWAGPRTWQSLGGELAVTARHDGHVSLDWALSYRSWDGSEWAFSTTTRHGADEEMRRLADRFAELLA